jgi:ABC-type lipoprotein release transport system permease subunit
MNISLFIAKRYLFAKKSHNIINIISIVSLAGTAVATGALFIVLSIFNGLQTFIEKSFNAFNADIEITPKEGKIIADNAIDLSAIAAWNEVEYLSPVLSDVAGFEYEEQKLFAKIKGVKSDYQRMNRMDTIICDGVFLLEDHGFPLAVLGIGISSKLNCPVSEMINNSLKVYYPDRTRKGSAVASIESLNSEVITPVGIFFSKTNYDIEYVIVPFDFAQQLLGYETGYTSLEIRCKTPKDVDIVQQRLSKRLGDDFFIKNAYQQEEMLYKVMQSEKWMIYAILSFILLISSFNMFGIIALLILEKKKDIHILHSMGADKKTIRRIFLYEGFLISVSGTLIGFVLGLIFCLLQIHFQFIGFGEGSYILDAYPVEIRLTNIIFIFLTVLCITLPPAYLPVRRLMGK